MRLRSHLLRFPPTRQKPAGAVGAGDRVPGERLCRAPSRWYGYRPYYRPSAYHCGYPYGYYPYWRGRYWRGWYYPEGHVPELNK